jgi:hypothetical protein
MGQRLNIEIISNGKLLANAYYHWDAYTGRSLQRTESILDKLNAMQKLVKDDLDLAIKLLESTGAGINAEERRYILASHELSKYLPINDCIDRNEGILAITKESMQNTRNWEEGRVTIDIGKRTILFRVYWEWAKEVYLDDYYDMERYEQLPTIDYDLKKEIPFDKFEELKNLYTSTIDSYGFKRLDGSVIEWIK